MDVTKTLLPGAPGTRRLMEKYGAALICVRYRRDRRSSRRVKTVEFIVEDYAGPCPAPANLPRRNQSETFGVKAHSRDFTATCDRSNQLRTAAKISVGFMSLIHQGFKPTPSTRTGVGEERPLLKCLMRERNWRIGKGKIVAKEPLQKSTI